MAANIRLLHRDGNRENPMESVGTGNPMGTEATAAGF